MNTFTVSPAWESVDKGAFYMPYIHW